MNRATTMVLLHFQAMLYEQGVPAVRQHIDEELDAMVEKLPPWFVDVCGVNFLADSEVDWSRLRDIVSETQGPPKK